MYRFHRLLLLCRQNKSLFDPCAYLSNNQAIKNGNKLFQQMPANERHDTIAATSAIHKLMKSGDIKSAENIFKSMKNKNIITYGAMMKGNI
jgi:pentatricopeptide repeat protein